MLAQYCFSSSEPAWEWLVTPNRMTAGQAPIERLRARGRSRRSSGWPGGLSISR